MQDTQTAAQPQPRYLSRAEAAFYVTQKYGFPCSKQTLAKLAVKGQGPEFKRANGRFAVYPVAGLDAWAATRIADAIPSSTELDRLPARNAGGCSQHRVGKEV
jgi:hypothetical protein